MNGRDALLFIAAMNGWSFPSVRRHDHKPERVCRLPGCDNMTSHNGGYCCADHCREHRRLRKVNAALSDSSEERIVDGGSHE